MTVVMRSLQTPRARRTVLAASAALFVLYFALGGLLGEIVWDITVFAQLTLAAFVVIGFDRNRVPWMLVIAGQTSFLVGDIGFTVLEYVLDSDAFPTIADAFYLIGYLLIALGLIPIARTDRWRRDTGGIIDATIITVAATSIMWVFIIEPTAVDTSASIFARVVAISYTFGDVLALGMLALLLSRRSGNDRAFWLTAASIATLFAADAVYAVLSLHGTYDLGGPLDAVWWISYTLLVLAILHPECQDLGAGSRSKPPRLTGWRLGALAVAAVAAPALLLMRIGSTAMSQMVVLLASTVAMFLLVIWRLQLIAGDLDDSRIRLSHDASHDALTGLANRTLLSREIRSATSQLGPDDELAVLFLDLDGFKPINDLLGHQTGDELLRVIAARLQSVVRDCDVVARVGGDEFAIMLRTATTDSAVAVAAQAIEAVRQSADIGGPVEVYPNASIGIAVGRSTSSTEDLLRDADIAMYSAKNGGKGRWMVFEDGIAGDVTNWLELRAELTNAVPGDQLFVEYQPVVSLDDHHIAAAEALVRWRHPELGVISPDRFISIAEETGLIIPIGTWVLEQACNTAVAWTSHPDGPDISVNVSPVQFDDPGLVAAVSSALATSGLPPQRLILELTESAQISSESSVRAVMADLRTLGVQIALDDLGSGFASLRYLQSLPIDIVKLDRSFMAKLDDDNGLLSGLIGLVRSLGIVTVVEGVETAHQERLSREYGAEYAQGYHYAPALSVSAIAELMSHVAPLQHQ